MVKDGALQFEEIKLIKNEDLVLEELKKINEINKEILEELS